MNFMTLPGNPVPGGLVYVGQAGFDKRIRCAYWLSSSLLKRGTVVLMQGFGEAIELHFSLIDQLLSRGFSVFCFDWRGQGGSGRLCSNPELGHIDKLSVYADDFNELIRAFVLPELPAPYFVLAADLGANVFLDSAPAPRSWCARALLVSPLIDLCHRTLHPWRHHRFSSMACWFGLEKHGVSIRDSFWRSGHQGDDWLTTNRHFLELMRKGRELIPRLTVDRPTYGLVSALSLSIKRFSAYSFPSKGHVPALLLSGSADRVVGYGKARALAEQLRGSHGLILKGGRHKLLFDQPSVLKQFWSLFDEFIARPF